jgi:cation transport ATPase
MMRFSDLIGLIAIADEVRPGATEAVKRLSRAGVRTVMLTGDNERSAKAIAHKVGVDEYRAQLLPTDKVDVIKKLREEFDAVAMVGDGINDAPAMAVADVGIAMGAAGTDIAIEAGDVVLMSDDLGRIAYVRELSHRTVSVIRQNIAISLINVAFMVGAALLGYLGLVTGLLLNEASAVFVILNALRLLSWRSNAEPRAPAEVESAQSVSVSNAGSRPSSAPAAGCCCSAVEPEVVQERGKPTGCCAAPAEPIPRSPASTGPCCSRVPEPAPPAPASCCCCGDANEPPLPTDGTGLVAATFRIDGMGCACEGQIIEKRVASLKGVMDFSLNPLTNQMKLVYDPERVMVEDIELAVKLAGMRAVLEKTGDAGGKTQNL